MDLTPIQLDALHEGLVQLTAPPEQAGSARHSTKKRPKNNG